MTGKRELVRGTANPFRDVGLAEPDTKLMKADLAAEIIRNAQLGRFTIDRLVTVLNRLDQGVEIQVTVKSGVADNPAPVRGGQ